MKKAISLFVFLLLIGSLQAQTEEEKVKQVLGLYIKAMEKLDVKGTEILFTTDSQIVESGGAEGILQRIPGASPRPRIERFKILQVRKL